MKNTRTHEIKDASLAARETFMASPAGSFLLAATAGGAVVLAVSLMLTGPTQAMPFAVLAGIMAYLLATIWTTSRLIRNFPHSTLGLCNVATLGRLVIVAILFVALLEGLAPSWATFGLAVLALGLDGIDGWLARKQGLSSEFGARFDVEVDAAFALVLAVFAAVNGAAGPYVILLGVPYYVFVAAKSVLPWLDQPLPEKFSRKVVCVFQIGALITLQVPFLADGRLGLVTLAVAGALLWSFGRDIFWLWRQSK